MKTVEYSFAASVFPWIKGYVEITQRDIMLCYPNVALWIIPNGKSKDIIPLRNISGVSIEKYNNWKSFFIGLVLALIGILVLIMIL